MKRLTVVEWALIASILFLVLGIINGKCNAQTPLHFKTVTFENANDLGLRVQRIEAVVDTIWADTIEGSFGFWNEEDSTYGVGLTSSFSDQYLGLYRKVTATNLENDKIETRYMPPLITRREVVEVAVTREVEIEWHPISIEPDKNGIVNSIAKFTTTTIPGEAVVWWREVRE